MIKETGKRLRLSTKQIDNYILCQMAYVYSFRIPNRFSNQKIYPTCGLENIDDMMAVKLVT